MPAWKYEPYEPMERQHLIQIEILSTVSGTKITRLTDLPSINLTMKLEFILVPFQRKGR